MSKLLKLCPLKKSIWVGIVQTSIPPSNRSKGCPPPSCISSRAACMLGACQTCLPDMFVASFPGIRTIFLCCGPSEFRSLFLAACCFCPLSTFNSPLPNFPRTFVGYLVYSEQIYAVHRPTCILFMQVPYQKWDTSRYLDYAALSSFCVYILKLTSHGK